MYRTNWTSACEIFRDLSVAQGDVPVSVEGTLGAGDKPSALNLKEETEEEYFLCSGGGVMEEGPDLGLIQEMLNMVREENLSEDEISKDAVVVITKPNPTPISTPIKPKVVKKCKEKKPKRRNIALESFIGIDVTPKNEIKLLKPEDIITKPKVEPDLIAVESVIEKVNDWLQSNEGTVKVNKKPVVCLEPPKNMFRKKNKGKSPVETPKEALSIKTESNPKSPNHSQSKEFVPSAYAMEYCNRVKEKAKVREETVDNIWTRAEKQMKIIDEKRKAETAIEALANHDAASTSNLAATTDTAAIISTVSTTDNAAIIDTVSTTDTAATTDLTVNTEEDRSTTITTNDQHLKSTEDPRKKLELPGHRHLLTDDCIICQAFTEFGYTGFCVNI